MRRSVSLFIWGTVAGLAALGVNFLFRLGGIAAFPPESALYAFLRVVPASIEEPMVQEFGDLAGKLGLLVATLIAGLVYGATFTLYDKFAASRVAGHGLTKLETLLVMGAVPWLVFGLALFPIDGDSAFGVASPFATPASTLVFPLALLLVQGVFAWIASARYSLPPVQQAPGAPKQDLNRREFIEKGAIGIVALAGVVMGILGLGQLFPSQLQVAGGSQPIDLAGAPAIFSDPRLATLVGSELTPDPAFYRVDIDLIAPTIDASGWSLMVDGLVRSPKSFSLQDVESFPEVTQYATMECVSNELNGSLIGNAKWGGTKISDVLGSAGGTISGASYVVFYSVDGYSVSIPLAKAMMPDSLLAYSMNDLPLPADHGYPLRGLIPGLYGMMSAKWIDRISVVGAPYDGYWQTRGWTSNAAVYTEAFIVLPSASSLSISQSGGSIVIAGFAFAGERGISKVEVSLDNGKTWQDATLKPALSALTWVLWAYEWVPPGAGEYKVIARATDGTGALQVSSVEGTFPNGATGYVSVILQLSD
ncbi:MAG: molybdopterin-dependent oxidoreductase [Nitrososphaerota archaeon]|nr:molybdopterin-dependent oxidoreductase [Nitrososphaerota archaeon]